MLFCKSERVSVSGAIEYLLEIYLENIYNIAEPSSNLKESRWQKKKTKAWMN
jgi:hypothetical protein